MMAVGGFGAEEEEGPPRTRCGYLPNESMQSFVKALTQSGPVATGRALHFAADVVCSGGFDVLVRSLWDYATAHIGIASPRVFVYLKKRVEELKDIINRLPDETAYSQEEFQVRVGELILVLREAPSRTALTWPKVGAETHSEAWIRTVGTAPETAVLRKVWRPEGDLSILRTVGAEICKGIGDGATERVLFWIKWLFEEEARMRKELKGSALTTIDRSDGHGGAKAGQKSGAGFFIIALYAETYKELAAKGVVRMNEEFQCLLNLWKGGDVPTATKNGILAILTLILCEVPRWKVPAAPSLIRDPVAMTQAIRQVPRFFREVLAYDPPKGGMGAKAFKARVGKGAGGAAAGKKGDAAMSKMDAFDAAMEAYFSRA